MQRPVSGPQAWGQARTLRVRPRACRGLGVRSRCYHSCVLEARLRSDRLALAVALRARTVRCAGGDCVPSAHPRPARARRRAGGGGATRGTAARSARRGAADAARAARRAARGGRRASALAAALAAGHRRGLERRALIDPLTGPLPRGVLQRGARGRAAARPPLRRRGRARRHRPRRLQAGQRPARPRHRQRGAARERASVLRQAARDSDRRGALRRRGARAARARRRVVRHRRRGARGRRACATCASATACA